MSSLQHRPPAFDDWPVEAKLEHLDLVHTRAGLIEMLLATAGYRPEREINSRSRLRKTELAAILLHVEE